MARETVSIAIEPAITSLKDPMKTWQTEDYVERPSPPKLPRHEQIGVGARFQVSPWSQNQDIVEQMV